MFNACLWAVNIVLHIRTLLEKTFVQSTCRLHIFLLPRQFTLCGKRQTLNHCYDNKYLILFKFLEVVSETIKPFPLTEPQYFANNQRKSFVLLPKFYLNEQIGINLANETRSSIFCFGFWITYLMFCIV